MSWFCPACLTRFPKQIARCPSDGWPPVEDLSGQELSGRYQLKRLIGVGGMGSTVWLARQTHIDRPVAVKLLPPSAEVPMRRFQREARIASNLRHPNIVTIFDYGPTDDGKLFLVMEYLDGQTVEQALKTHQRLEVRRALHIAIQVLRALSHAHSKRVVHRDLKPSNLFLTPTGEDMDFVKVLDFGLAKYFADSDADAASRPVGQAEFDVTGQRQVVCGTPSYMAPEQWRGRIDARTDIYGLGIILYRMITGQLPFTGNPTDYELYHKIITEPVPPLRELAPDVELPEGLEPAILRALAKDPDKRYASAREMRSDLDRVVRKLPQDLSISDQHALPNYGPQVAHTLPADHPDDPEAVYLLSADFHAVPESQATPSGDSLHSMEYYSRRDRVLPWIVAGVAAAVTILLGVLVFPGMFGHDGPPVDETGEVAAERSGTLTAARLPGGSGSGVVIEDPPVGELGDAPVAPGPGDKPQPLDAPKEEPETVPDTPAPQPDEQAEEAPESPAEEAVEEPRPIGVMLRTTPKGATISTSEGEKLGSAPLQLNLEPGEYEYQVSLRGHISEKVTVRVGELDRDDGIMKDVRLTALTTTAVRKPKRAARRTKTRSRKPRAKPSRPSAASRPKRARKPKANEGGGARVELLGEGRSASLRKQAPAAKPGKPRKPGRAPRIQLLDESAPRDPARTAPPPKRKPTGKVQIETLDD